MKIIQCKKLYVSFNTAAIFKRITLNRACLDLDNFLKIEISNYRENIF